MKDGREKKSEVARTRELLSWEVLAFFLAASLKPDIKALEASVKATIESFDFGVPVRQARPKSDMGGIINLDVDLKSSADSFSELLANGK